MVDLVLGDDNAEPKYRGNFVWVMTKFIPLSLYCVYAHAISMCGSGGNNVFSTMKVAPPKRPFLSNLIDTLRASLVAPSKGFGSRRTLGLP
jgi:hypothetical protein